MAKERETVEFSANGKTTGPIPMEQFEKSVKNAKSFGEEMIDTIEGHKKWEKKVMKKAHEHDANEYGMDLLDSLDSKREEINGHLHRIIDHAVSNPDSKPGNVTLRITAVSEKGDVIVEAKIKSVIPNEIDGIYPLAKISRDDGQLTLFD